MKFIDFIGGVWEMYNNYNKGGHPYGYAQGFEQAYPQGFKQGRVSQGYMNPYQGGVNQGGGQYGGPYQGYNNGFNYTPMPLQAPLQAQGQAPGQGGYNSPPQGYLRPTGGALAQGLGFGSPYYNASTQKFRKPTQAELITEISLATFGTEDGITKNNIEDGGEYIRHVCREGTLLHYLPRVEYPVVLPNSELVILYYAHADCGTLTYIGDTLRN